MEKGIVKNQKIRRAKGMKRSLYLLMVLLFSRGSVLLLPFSSSLSFNLFSLSPPHHFSSESENENGEGGV